MPESEWSAIAERGWDAFPEEAKNYVETVENLLGKKIKLVSIGARAGMEVTR
ncbi:MAG: adenylosuccinate synthetase [Thaumarchaeota archaeon]|nr:adenylosuccinate synthetase [Nitrososphaerota archaeon]